MSTLEVPPLRPLDQMTTSSRTMRSIWPSSRSERGGGRSDESTPAVEPVPSPDGRQTILFSVQRFP
jgi:hypothetical protein